MSAFDLRKPFFNLGTIALVLTFMVVARQILIPLSLAGLFAGLLSPVVNYLNRKGWPNFLAITVGMLGFLLFAGGIIFILTFEIITIAKELPDFSGKAASLLTEISEFLRVYVPGVEITTDWKQLFGEQFEGGGKMILNYAGDIGGKLINIVLIPIFLALFLIYRDIPARFIKARFKGKENRESATQIFTRIKEMITQYLVGTLWFTLVTAVMSFIILISVGSDYVLFFSIVIALLNLIPYVGTIIAFVIVIGYQVVAIDGLFMPFITWALLWVSNLIQENILRPFLIGRSTRINALTVLLSVIIGSMIWGVAGMILFIPLVGVLKIILEEIPELRPYSIFFSDEK